MIHHDTDYQNMKTAPTITRHCPNRNDTREVDPREIVRVARIAEV